MKARITKGGWFYKGEMINTGDVIDETPEWIANRQRDGLAEPTDDGQEPVNPPAKTEPEAAITSAPENAAMPRARGRRASTAENS